MKHLELIVPKPPVTSAFMQERGQCRGRSIRLAAVLMGGAAALGGCVSVTAPDKPIVIELNINIKQEVVYRIAKDVANTIDENPEIF